MKTSNKQKEVYIAKSQCYGCGACQEICPQKCIAMEEDGEGFLYPVVDIQGCNGCGLCEETCPIINLQKNDDLNIPKETYALWHLDEEMRYKSSSGGAFSLFAEHILDKNGIVFGAAFDAKMVLRHVAVCDKKQLERMQGSKYLQSDISNSYQQAKRHLDQDKHVLFCGTPCQIKGLYAYLHKGYNKLYTCDVVCLGVCSPKVFKKYTEYKGDGRKLEKVNFRDKTTGWHDSSIKLEYDNSVTYSELFSKNKYAKGFGMHLYLRPSCYQCPYADEKRIGDITLGDFWGIDKIKPEIDDNKGISLVLFNTQKGIDLFEQTSKNAYYEKASLNKAKQYNGSLTKPAFINYNRKRFFKDLGKLEFSKMIDKYFDDRKLYGRVYNVFYRLLRKVSKI